MAEEKNFENKVKKFLKDNDCWFVKYFANGFTKSGIPDILCCCNGHFIGIEVKADGGKPSPLQIHNLEEINESGGFGVLLYPKDFDLFKNMIEGIITANDLKFYQSYLHFRREVFRWKQKLKDC